MSPRPTFEPPSWRPRPGVLRRAEVRRALAERPGWRLAGDRLERRVRLADFDAAVRFVGRVADAAEHFSRHPSICIDEAAETVP